MSVQSKPKFAWGKNIAMKIPAHQFDEIFQFYGKTLGLRQIMRDTNNDLYPSVGFEFGDKRLWIDKCDHLSHPETWFEIETNDLPAAKAYFKEQGIARRDEIETLPRDFKGFWIANPAGTIHLVTSA